MKNTDSRYPFTYAYDYLRNYGGMDSHGLRLSRADAGQVVAAVAKALNFTQEQICQKLADYYLLNQNEESKNAAEKLIQCIRG